MALVAELPALSGGWQFGFRDTGCPPDSTTDAPAGQATDPGRGGHPVRLCTG